MKKVQILIICCIFGGMGGRIQAQSMGCTDPQALNFSPEATINNGTCLYRLTNHSPKRLAALPLELPESSGLAKRDQHFISHNDSGWPGELFLLDSLNWNVERTVRVRGVNPKDWEDITGDAVNIYVGDFGNNNGNRQDLVILKIRREDLNRDTVEAESIFFQYPDQNNFVSAPQANNYDMEAMICFGDSLYLFSKNWLDNKTRVYSLPKVKGNYTAKLLSEWDVQGLITGATADTINNRVVLVGYTSLLLPFVWILWDFQGNDFFSGNKRRIDLNLPFHQTEAVEYDYSNNRYLLTNERFSNFLITIPARVHELFINQWTENPTSPSYYRGAGNSLVYPNPTMDKVFIQGMEGIKDILLVNHLGVVLEQHQLNGQEDFPLDLSLYPDGIYYIIVQYPLGRIDRIKVLKR